VADDGSEIFCAALFAHRGGSGTVGRASIVRRIGAAAKPCRD
jgi:hypothetical protein